MRIIGASPSMRRLFVHLVPPRPVPANSVRVGWLHQKVLARYCVSSTGYWFYRGWYVRFLIIVHMGADGGNLSSRKIPPCFHRWIHGCATIRRRAVGIVVYEDFVSTGLRGLVYLRQLLNGSRDFSTGMEHHYKPFRLPHLQPFLLIETTYYCDATASLPDQYCKRHHIIERMKDLCDYRRSRAAPLASVMADQHAAISPRWSSFFFNRPERQDVSVLIPVEMLCLVLCLSMSGEFI